MFNYAIDLIKQQIITAATNDGHNNMIAEDVDNFAKLALAGYDYAQCCNIIFKTEEEAERYGFLRLHEICAPLVNAEVAAAIYQDAIENNNHQAQKIIAETRMNWTKTENKNVNISEHDRSIILDEI